MRFDLDQQFGTADVAAQVDGVARRGTVGADAGFESLAHHLQVGRATRHGIVARRIDVVMPHEEHVHRHLADMRALIDAAGMPERAARRAHRTFQLLAQASNASSTSPPR